MKILVTGGAGYIGSHTIIELIRSGDNEIISIDNFSNSSLASFERIKKITGRNIINYSINLSDREATLQFFKDHKDINKIIHFAALKSVSGSMKQPLLYYRNNVDGLINVLDGALITDCNIFIFSSSCTVYGNIDVLPVNEETELKAPESVYGHTKQIGERIIKDYTHSSGSIQCVALRYFNPVGAHPSGLTGEAQGDKPENLIPVITAAASKRQTMSVYGDDYDTRDGSCIRDYVHVCDIADAHIKAIEYLESNKNIRYDVFNLGTGNGISVFEMINAFERISGIKLNYSIGKRRQGDIPVMYSDSSKATALLKWKADLNVDKMLSSAWKWQKQLSSNDRNKRK